MCCQVEQERDGKTKNNTQLKQGVSKEMAIFRSISPYLIYKAHSRLQAKKHERARGRTKEIFYEAARSQQVLQKDYHRPNMAAHSAVHLLNSKKELLCLWLINR